MTTAFIGQPVSRVDGRLKVTGDASYAAEFDVPGLAYGAIVRTTGFYDIGLGWADRVGRHDVFVPALLLVRPHP